MPAAVRCFNGRLSTGQQDAKPKQIKSGAPIHLPFEPLEAIDLAFHLSLFSKAKNRQQEPQPDPVAYSLPGF